MRHNYYYFVAGLPDLLLDEGKVPVDSIEFALEAKEQLSSEDYMTFNLLRLPFDNYNLIGLIGKKQFKFDKRGSIEEADLTEGLKFPDTLPAYMGHFLETLRENRSPYTGLTPSDQLAWFFYEAMLNEKSDFIRHWYEFDLHLRNVVVALNCRRNIEHIEALATERERPAAMLIIGRDDISDAILKSNAPDFGLSAQLPWIERLLALSRSSALEFEKGIDTLRWEILNEMTISSYFQAETVYAFYLKLNIVERWKALDADEGKRRLDKLLGELKATYSVPASF